MHTQTIRIDFEVHTPDDGVPPTPMSFSQALWEGLPDDWHEDSNGEFWIENQRWGSFHDQDRIANLVKKNDSQIATIKAYQKAVDRHIEEKRELCSKLDRLPSVGVTHDEAEKLRYALHNALDRINRARVEDLEAVIEDVYGAVNDAVEQLPILEERDLGWGTDEQLTELEEAATGVAGHISDLQSTLDEIRTQR